MSVDLYYLCLVSGVNRCTIHMDVYANVLVVRITKYPTLMAVMRMLFLLVFSCLVSPAGGN